MTKDIVVIGAGGFGRETLDVIEAINEASSELVWNVVGILDDDPSDIDVARLTVRGYDHLGAIDDNRAELASGQYVIAIGSPTIRAEIARSLVDAVAADALVHPRAVLGSQVTLATGVVVCGGVQVSTNVRLRKHVHLNPGAIIGHDAEFAPCVSVNPGAVVSGGVRIGEGALIGAGAVILQGLQVGDGVIVGASACVTRDVAPGAVVKGVPAR